MTKSYNSYLIENSYSKSTIYSYTNAKSRFIEWCDLKGFAPNGIDYKSCLEYVREMQKPTKGKSISKRSVNHSVGALKVFFRYLIDTSERDDNPMESINIRGIRRSINHNLLEFEELEDLFYSYSTLDVKPPNCPHVAVRDKVIIGFMVYQGLDAKALMSLKLEHVQIEKGKLYVPSTRKTNSRELELKSPQMLSLIQYLQHDRTMLQEKIDSYDNKLFPSNSGRSTALFATLFKRLRTINYKIKNAKQIRASVITYWLKLYNIRRVQYMVGHRYISSTEKYLQDDLESLHEMIESLHPIN